MIVVRSPGEIRRIWVTAWQDSHSTPDPAFMEMWLMDV
jgi:hypothetical protein